MLDDGDGDIARINENTTAFAVCFENKPVADDLSWDDYMISIDSRDLLSTLPHIAVSLRMELLLTQDACFPLLCQAQSISFFDFL